MDAIKSQQKLTLFFNNYRKKTVKKGDQLEMNHSVYFLSKGLIKMSSITSGGEELTFNIFKEGTFFPMIDVFTSPAEQYQYQYVAVQNSEVIMAPIEEFSAYIKEDPELLWDLLQRVFKGMDGLLQRMIQFMSGDAYKKTVVQLILLAKRFGVEGDEGLRIALPLTHVEISNHAGISRETVSRMMKALEHKGLIRYSRNKIIIENLPLLEKELVSEE